VQLRNGLQPGDLGSFGEWTVATRRKRGPVALRHQLWLGLPLSTDNFRKKEIAVNSEIYVISGMGQQQSLGSLSLEGLLSSAYQPFTLSRDDGRLTARSRPSLREIIKSRQDLILAML